MTLFGESHSTSWRKLTLEGSRALTLQSGGSWLCHSTGLSRASLHTVARSASLILQVSLYKLARVHYRAPELSLYKGGGVGALTVQLQHTATHCNTLQHTATYLKSLTPHGGEVASLIAAHCVAFRDSLFTQESHSTNWVRVE